MLHRPSWAVCAGLAAFALTGAVLAGAGLRRALSEEAVDRPAEPEPDFRALLTCVLPDPEGPVLRGRPPPEPPPPEPIALRPPVTVRVIDARTREPLAGVRVEVTGLVAPEGVDPETRFARETGSGGAALFQDLPAAGHAVVRAIAPAPAPFGDYPFAIDDPEGSMRAIQALHAELMSLTGPDSTWVPLPKRPPEPWTGTPFRRVMASASLGGSDISLAVPATLALEVDVVSDADGRPLVGAVWRTSQRVAWTAKAGDPVFVAADHERPLPIELEVSAPPGHLAYDLRTWRPRLHPRARRLVATYPLRRMASVDVLLSDAGPAPARCGGALVLRVADVNVHAGLGGVAFDRLRMEGGPHLPGERVHLSGRIGVEWTLSDSAEVPDGPVAAIVLTPVLTAIPQERRELLARLLDFVSSHSGFYSCRGSEVFGSRFGLQAAAPVPAAPDAASTSVLHVAVTDAGDRPVPFATLTVELSDEAVWIDIDGEGTQRLDPFTDVRGRRTLRDLAPGPATIRASYGTRAAAVQVTLVPGEELVLPIRLPSVLPEVEEVPEEPEPEERR